MTPLVSVVIPCYNAERWIVETLASVRNQTWKNIEIIVVDDGSNDDSCKLVRQFSSDIVTLTTQKNAGAASARNHGLHLSRGDFIQFLDSDDLLEPSKIELQLARLTHFPDSVATSAWVRFHDVIDEARFVPDASWQDLSPIDWLLANWDRGGGMLFPAMWLIPRNIAINAGPWNESLTLNDDGEYFTRVALASDQVLFCRQAQCYYRSGIQGSLSGLKSEAGWHSQHSSIELCGKHLLARENSERTRRAVSMLWQRFAYASYPYSKKLGNMAIQNAQKLHQDRLEPEGGALFRILNKILGWRAAVKIQNVYYTSKINDVQTRSRWRVKLK